jgi:hypothetical protein
LLDKLCAAGCGVKELADSGELTESEMLILADLTSRPGRLMAQLLRYALPTWVERARGLSRTEFEARRTYAVDVVASRTDVLERSSKRGQAAAGFNAIAEGLGLLAAASPDGPDRIEHWLDDLESA